MHPRAITIVGTILSAVPVGSIAKAARRGNRRRITRAVLSLLVVLPLVLGIAQSPNAWAQNQDPALSMDQNRAATPLGSILNSDGTLNLDGSFSGSLDPTGWTMVNLPGTAPRFVPSGSKPVATETPAAIVKGAGNSDPTVDPDGVNDSVSAVAVHGTDVYVGGNFTAAGGVQAFNIAKWNGSAWSALGSSTNGTVKAIAINAGGDVYVGGYFLIAGGVFASNIAKWNGSVWSALGIGTNGPVNTIAISASGDVYVGGSFTGTGSVTANNIVKWDGTTWHALGGGTGGPVNAIASLGSSLFVGGSFNTAGGLPASHIATWNGSSWSALGSGTSGTVYSLAQNGSDIYVGGTFGTAGGVTANNIARFNNGVWSALGSGTNGNVYSIAIHGSSVYAGGFYSTAGGM